jgi:hypothetical protein
MRYFVQKLAIFLSILLIYFFVNWLVNNYTLKNIKPTIKGSVLAIGDSYIQNAINPAFTKDWENIAQTAEPYYVSYFKLKKIMEDYPIDTIILGFSPHHISSYNDEKLQDPTFKNEILKRLYAITHKDKLKNLGIDNMDFLKVYLKNVILFPKLKHHAYVGSYYQRSGKNKNAEIHLDAHQVIQNHFFEKEKLLNISQLSLNYLDSIMALAIKNHAQLILIATPVHPTYFEEIPLFFTTAWHNQKEFYEKEGLIVLNHQKFLEKDEYFFNSNHLNDKGAEFYTTYLVNQLKIH